MPFTDSGVNFIKAEALNGDSSLDRSSFTHIAESTHEKLKRSILAKNDVLITIAGAQVGRCGIVRSEHLPANTNQAVGIIRVDPNLAVPSFVYYHLKNPKTFQMCQSIGGQAAQPNINLEMLKGFDLALPDRTSQLAITDILSAYDDLIENNRRRIGLLEEAARLLYREWFVYFRFPGHEHVKLTNGLPEGWQPQTIEEMTRFLGRGISPSYDDEADFVVVNQKCIRDRMLSMAPARKQKKEFPSAKALQFLDVLINSTGTGTLGRVAQCWFNPTGVTFDSHVTVARPNGSVDPYWFGYALLALESVFDGMGDGATNQKELARTRIASMTITAPSISLQKTFGLFTADSCRQIQVLAEQNEKLAAARDLLLPRLMSGEVAV
jgi:type I restriction enzyme S subunit